MQVIINADGRTCTTVNPLGDFHQHVTDPDEFSQYYAAQVYEWQKAQDERQTFEIEPSGCNPCKSLGVAHCAHPEECLEHWPHKPGEIRDCEIVNGKAVIK